MFHGVPNKKQNSEEGLRNRGVPGGPQRRGQHQKRLHNQCLLRGPKVGGMDVTPTFSGLPTKGTKSKSKVTTNPHPLGGLLPTECLTTSRRPVRLKVADGHYMVGGTKEAEIALQFVNHYELSRPDLGKEILLKGNFYEAQMDWGMIVGYDFMMETDSCVLPAQASMTVYQDDQLSWLSSLEHHAECQWIHPEQHQLDVASLGIEPVGPTDQEYSVKPEPAHRIAAERGAPDPALDAFSSGTSAHLRVCEKY